MNRAISFFLLFLSACSSLTQSGHPDSHCSPERIFSCYDEGYGFLEKGDWEKAIPLLKRGCDSGIANACSDLAYSYAKSKSMFFAITAARRGCNLNDALSCYNLACYHCRQNEKKQALEALSQALELGMRGREKIEADPDFQCLKNDPAFRSTLDSVNRFGEPLESSARHVYLNSVRASSILPFPADTRNDPVVMVDSSGSNIIITPVSLGVHQVIREADSPNIGMRILSSQTKKKNGLTQTIQEIRIPKMPGSNQDWSMIRSVIGTNAYSVITTGTYPTHLGEMVGAMIRSTVETVIFNPRHIPKQEDALVRFSTPPGGLKFAGFLAGNAVYSPNGKLSLRNNQGLSIRLVHLIETPDETIKALAASVDRMISLENTVLTTTPFVQTQAFPGFEAYQRRITFEPKTKRGKKSHLVSWVLRRSNPETENPFVSIESLSFSENPSWIPADLSFLTRYTLRSAP